MRHSSWFFCLGHGWPKRFIIQAGTTSEQAYVIEVEDAGSAEAEVVEEVPFSVVVMHPPVLQTVRDCGVVAGLAMRSNPVSTGQALRFTAS